MNKPDENLRAILYNHCANNMKFSKHFISEMTSLPQALQDHLIDYKRYKKYIKSCASISEFIEKVSCDATHADAFLRKVMKNKKQPISCCTSYRYDKKDIYTFMSLNATSLYKVCKRATKRMHTREPMNWWSTIQNKNELCFLNGMMKTKIELDNVQNQQRSTIECPVCLDNISKDIMIMNCGHVICMECVKGMLHVSHTKGTVHNLIAHGRHVTSPNASCPLCRNYHAFIRYKIITL